MFNKIKMKTVIKNQQYNTFLNKYIKSMSNTNTKLTFSCDKFYFRTYKCKLLHTYINIIGLAPIESGKVPLWT